MIHCKHCQLPCKTPGKNECSKYNPISKLPDQLPILIREAFRIGNYELGRKLQEDLFRINNG